MTPILPALVLALVAAAPAVAQQEMDHSQMNHAGMDHPGMEHGAARVPKNAQRLGAAGLEGNIRKGKDGKCHIVRPAPGQSAGQVAPCPR